MSNLVNDPISIKLFKVGGANSIAIEYNDGKCLFFDCGIKPYKDKNKYTKGKNKVINIKPTAVVISHDHVDHFNLFCDLKFNDDFDLFVKRKTPDERIYSERSKDIIQKKWKCEITEIDLDDNNVKKDILIKKGYGGTYIYTPKAVPTDENINETGLILVVYSQSKNRKVILPADVSYDMWPDSVKNLLKKNHSDKKPITLVLPHHGGTVQYDDFKKLNPNTLNHNIKFYRCSNYLDFNGHPNAKNHKKLIDTLYGTTVTVDSTEKATNGYIELLP